MSLELQLACVCILYEVSSQPKKDPFGQEICRRRVVAKGATLDYSFVLLATQVAANP
jgi:hypothetical protein